MAYSKQVTRLSPQKTTEKKNRKRVPFHELLLKLSTFKFPPKIAAPCSRTKQAKSNKRENKHPGSSSPVETKINGTINRSTHKI
uniref:Uncharacterized protein n=1 Tax=Cucumis melo TaxID=3656 RepID=A0A9I9E792_CUCME